MGDVPKLDNKEGSRCSFFKRGLTTVCLKAAGMDPEVRLVFIKTSSYIYKKNTIKNQYGVEKHYIT